jgi:glucosamine-6-phosphate deaminase
MRTIIVKDPKQMGVRAAGLIVEEMRKHAVFVLGLVPGTTSIPLYKEFIRRHQEEGLDFSTFITFNLDEYVGLPYEHPENYHYFMQEMLFRHININPKLTHIPNGNVPYQTPDDLKRIEEMCDEYERMIDDIGGLDYQVLGIGVNGHIGFNEPGSSLGSLTRIKTLSDQTRRINARFFSGNINQVPQYAITMGIGSILKARKVILLATGENKAEAVRTALEGPVTSMCPASALQLHRYATFIIDEPAASRLTLKTYEYG